MPSTLSDAAQTDTVVFIPNGYLIQRLYVYIKLFSKYIVNISGIRKRKTKYNHRIGVLLRAGIRTDHCKLFVGFFLSSERKERTLKKINLKRIK